MSWEHTPGLGEPPTLSSSHYVQLITHPQLFWVWGVFLSKSCSAIPRHQLLNRWGPWGTCRGILPSIADSLLPPKVGEHLFFLIPLFFLPPQLTRSLVLLPALLVHCTELQAHTEKGGLHQGASREVPRAGLSRAQGQGLVWCCMAAGTPGSRAEHLGPMDTQWPRESSSSPEGIQRVKLSSALARQLRGAHLSHPRNPFRALC